MGWCVIDTGLILDSFNFSPETDELILTSTHLYSCVQKNGVCLIRHTLYSAGVFSPRMFVVNCVDFGT